MIWIILFSCRENSKIDTVDTSESLGNNVAPTIESIALLPSEVYTNDLLTVTVEFADQDGQNVSGNYAWHVIDDGVDSIVQNGHENGLDGVVHFDRGDTVYVVVTPSDGMDDGAIQESDRIEILNTLPTSAVISLSPTDLNPEEQELACVVETASMDADFDPILYTFLWTDPSGNEIRRQTQSEGRDVLSEADLNMGTWMCTVTPNDGIGDGESVSTSIEINPSEDIDGWTLVWSDEFNDTNIDLDKWSFEVNGTGGGNNELQYYTDRSDNARIENGSLIIEAREESYTGADGTRNYTSARLRTLGKGDWLYGRMEARIRIPQGQGIWPAFWMLPSAWVYGGWAASGEIDIMENVGHEPNVVHGTLHYGGPWPTNTYTGAGYTLEEPFANDFHLFAVEWQEGEIRWYVDGIHTQTQTNWYSTNGAYPAPFNQEFHILLNVAVGGTWPGSPDSTTVFPQKMEVDYVRVYSKEGEEEESNLLTLTVDTSCMDGVAQTVALTGPWAGNWNPNQALSANDNGDGTWSVTRSKPSHDIEYLWIVNGNYENLIEEMQNGGDCAPITDYWSYANRVWSVGSPNPSVAYNQCTACP